MAASKPAGATAAVTRRRDQLRAWALHHRALSLGALRDLLATPLASCMTWLTMGIALALPAILSLLLSSLSALSDGWGGQPKVSLYLKQAVPEAEARLIARKVGGQAGVASALFVSRASALAEFQQKSGFGDVLSTLEQNPLPHLVEVRLDISEPAAIQSLVQALKSLKGVEAATLDLAWLERLEAFLAFGERLALALALALGAGLALVMGNTIRLAILGRRQEIEIIKLVGGTDGFVRRPFLYLGFWHGAGGALMALALTWAATRFLSAPMAQLAHGYGQGAFALHLPAPMAFLLLAVGIGLGLLGALLAVSRHLRDIKP